MRLLAVVVAAGAVTLTAGATTPAIKLTTAGNTRAQGAMLRLADLGQGWKAAAAPSGGLQVACPGFQPDLKGVVEIGAATSDSFRDSTIGPFISETGSVYGSPAQAATVWSRVATPALITCVVQSVQALGTKANGLKVKLVSRGEFTIQKPTKLVTAYRVIANLSSPKVKYVRKIYFDVVLVSKKATVAEITVASYQEPVPASIESAIAAVVAHRIT
jgi:hypothetical protein